MITKTTKEIVEELAKYYCSKTSDFQLDEVLRIKGREWVSLKELQKALEICVLNSRTFNKKGFSGLLDCRELEEEFKRVIFGVVPLSPEKKRVICFDGYPMIDRDTSREKEIMLGMPKKKRCGVCRK